MTDKYIILNMDNTEVLEKATAYVNGIDKEIIPLMEKTIISGWFEDKVNIKVKFKVQYSFKFGDIKQERIIESDNKEDIIEKWESLIKQINSNQSFYQKKT